MRKGKQGEYFESLLGQLQLTTSSLGTLARDKGFAVRTPRKITPENFLRLSLAESLNAQPSYNDMAARLEAETGISASRQAICQRMNEACVAFMQAILAKAMKGKLSGKTPGFADNTSPYGRMLVQDSTILRLPSRLFEDYSGVANAHATACNARLQVVYDLLAGEFVSFSLDPYSKTDSASAADLELCANDLVLRDRGYLSANEIQRHLEAGADCVYRHMNTTIYADPETGSRIDLLAQLRQHGSLDMEVRLGNAAGTVCRLVAAPVNEETANLRRMKLKKEAHGHAPSKELLELMSWTVLITTIERSKASFKDLLGLYGLRWRIETIFKAWKSNMNFARIHNVSKRQLLVLIGARLIMVVAVTHFIYRPMCTTMRGEYGREASLMKTTRYFARNPDRIGEAILALHDNDADGAILDALARYCTYDKRKRPCFNEELDRYAGVTLS